MTGTTVVVTTYIGPQTIEIGTLGTCQITPPYNSVTTNYAGSNCTGGSPTAFSIGPGSEDIDTLVVQFITINTVVTTTTTTLTSTVYEIDGIAAGAPSATPAPPSLILAFLGLAGVGLYAARRASASGKRRNLNSTS